MFLFSREADLNICPTAQTIDGDPSTHVSVGDLHGNALKLIYTLIQEGFLTLSDENDYRTLHEIYNKDVYSLTKECIHSFESIINKAQCNNKRALTIIGDELADRGNNDYFTLCVLNKLHLANVDVEVLLSNHSAEFISNYDSNKFTGKTVISAAQTRSLKNMTTLIGRSIVNEAAVRDLVSTAYLPMLKGIGYTISPDKKTITIFTHAPVGLETIKSLSDKYGIQYSDESIDLLAETIDQINSKINNDCVARELYSKMVAEGREITAFISPDRPLTRLMWNRVADFGMEDGFDVTPAGDFKVKFVHGHVGLRILKAENHLNLDGYFGMGARGDDKTDGGERRHLIRVSSDIRPQKQLQQLQENTSPSHYNERLSFLKPAEPALLDTDFNLEEPGYCMVYH